MADAVTSKVVFSGSRRYVIHLTNLSDGTGESNVVKVDKSTLVGPDGTEPSKLVVEKIQYSTFGMAVKLTWDQTSDETIAILNGYGELKFLKAGGLVGTETGGTGDILLTTVGHTSGDSYDLVLHLRLKD